MSCDVQAIIDGWCLKKKDVISLLDDKTKTHILAKKLRLDLQVCIEDIQDFKDELAQIEKVNGEDIVANLKFMYDVADTIVNMTK